MSKEVATGMSFQTIRKTINAMYAPIKPKWTAEENISFSLWLKYIYVTHFIPDYCVITKNTINFMFLAISNNTGLSLKKTRGDVDRMCVQNYYHKTGWKHKQVTKKTKQAALL